MSGKQVKRMKRIIRKESDKIKIKGLQEFIVFCNSHSFLGRVKIALKIVFKVRF